METLFLIVTIAGSRVFCCRDGLGGCLHRRRAGTMGASERKSRRLASGHEDGRRLAGHEDARGCTLV